MMHTHMSRMCVGLVICLVFECLFRFSILCVLWFSLDYFVLVLFTFVVSGLVCSVLRQEVGWEEHLRNDQFCVEWDKKT